jgi:flagellar protein FlaG
MSPMSAASGRPQIDWPGNPVATPAPANPVHGAGAQPQPQPLPLPDAAEQARAAARLLQEYLQQNGHDMKFTVDQATGITIVRIYNSASGELVRQIPNEEIVHVAELLHQEMRRASVDVTA